MSITLWMTFGMVKKYEIKRNTQNECVWFLCTKATDKNKTKNNNFQKKQQQQPMCFGSSGFFSFILFCCVLLLFYFSLYFIMLVLCLVMISILCSFFLTHIRKSFASMKIFIENFNVLFRKLIDPNGNLK